MLKLDRCDEALAAFEAAGDARPGYGAAFNGQALALRALGRIGEARAAFEAAEALGNREAVSGRGCLVSCSAISSAAGRATKRAGSTAIRSPRPSARVFHWRGPGRAGERVLVMNDHGFGDTIQFCRYLPLMAAAGVEPTFLCPPRLHRLLSSLTGSRSRRTAAGANASTPRSPSAACRAPSPPGSTACRPLSPISPPNRTASRKWAARIGAEGFKIGIVWQGNPNPEADMARSAPLAASRRSPRLPGSG